MASLVTCAEVRAQTGTDLPDATVQPIIDACEAEMLACAGPHYKADGITERFYLGQATQANLYLSRPIGSVKSVTEAGEAVDADAYEVWAEHGMLARVDGSYWTGAVVVVYVPVDDTAQRKQVLIDLCRLEIERKAMQTERIADYSYQAPDWDAAKAKLLRSLSYAQV